MALRASKCVEDGTPRGRVKNLPKRPLPRDLHADPTGIVQALAGSAERDIAPADAGVALGPVREVPFEKAPQRYSLAEVKSQAGLNPRHVLRRRGSVNQERRGRGPGQK